MVKTKIIATLGPSSNKASVLRNMYKSGLDIARLNFSHGSHQEHIQRIETIKLLNKKMRRAIKIMQDLEGYRIRIGKLEKPIQLKKKKEFYLTQEDVLGNQNQVHFDYYGPLAKVEKDMLIYIDDGKIVLLVKDIQKKRLKVRSLTDGLLRSNKGVNIPEAKLEFPAITAKDKDDLKVALKYDLDYVAQSFVRNAKDVRALRRLLKGKEKKIKIFAKIESRQALDNLEKIIKEADGVIVARGDLGVCVPIYKVPVIQKKIIQKCREMKKPAVVATQMLDSMTEESLPTRAEVSDVANAILDGASHLLLSAETAVGKHPAKVVDMMNKIIKYSENYQQQAK